MAGDKADQLGRLRKLLPPWFGDTYPLLSALLSGFASAQAFIYDLIGYAKLQTRIRTATGGWLDLIASDFLGPSAQRQVGQSDASFRTEILMNLFRERATRPAMERVLVDLTGRLPIVFEPGRVQDTGAYDTNTIGYGVTGAYGSLRLPFQAFITAYLPAGSGIPSVSGYSMPAGGYGQASQLEYADLGMVHDPVRQGDIMKAVDGVKPVATIAWVRIGNTVDAPADLLPDFALIVGNKPVRFGPSGTPLRLLGIDL